VSKLFKKTQETTPLKKSYKVKSGDAIVIENLERFIDGGVLEEAAWVAMPIVHEETDYVVINKPK
jgi:23S rRNA-/tRNA-specific pseudouridylate synthase